MGCVARKYAFLNIWNVFNLLSFAWDFHKKNQPCIWLRLNLGARLCKHLPNVQE